MGALGGFLMSVTTTRDVQMLKRMELLRDAIERLTGGECYGKIVSTEVLRFQAEKRGKPLHAFLQPGEVDSITYMIVPKIEAWLTKSTESGTQDLAAFAKIIRFWCYRYIEKAWLAVKKGAAGTVQESTLARKKADRFAIVEEPYGVRHGKGRGASGGIAWYDIMKGDRKTGIWDKRHIEQVNRCITVVIGGLDFSGRGTLLGDE